jgi:hypothetical protein
MTHTPQLPHDSVDEREWALQEQALRAERLGLDRAADVDMQRYRTIARALKEPLDVQLPADFATKTARRAMQRNASGTSLELWMSYTLFGVLGAMMVVWVFFYSPMWLQPQQWAMPIHDLANPWLLALIVCVALTAALGKLTPHHTPPTRRLG